MLRGPSKRFTFWLLETTTAEFVRRVLKCPLIINYLKSEMSQYDAVLTAISSIVIHSVSQTTKAKYQSYSLNRGKCAAIAEILTEGQLVCSLLTCVHVYLFIEMEKVGIEHINLTLALGNPVT